MHLESTQQTIENQWPAQHVLVIGDVMLDKYIHGLVERISPEAPIPVVKTALSRDQPGGAANVAMNIAGLGAHVTLVGFRGHDSDGQTLEKLLETSGVRTRLLTLPDQPTITKTRILGGSQQMLRLDREWFEPIKTHTSADLLTAALSLFDSAREPGVPAISAVVLSDYAKGTLTAEACQAIVHRARSLHLPVLVDPKGSDYTRYRGATTLCPNLAELARATSTDAGDLDAVLTAGEAMLKTLNIASFHVTLSERGIAHLDGNERKVVPARARQVFDVSGAGDTVTAVLALAIATGMPTSQALQLANLAAGVVVGKIGTSPIHLADLLPLPARDVASINRVLLLHDLVEQVQTWRSKGDRIVFTNGCFDLLHGGHLTLLEEAKRQGDRLIVGLNTDASVRALKGPARPVNDQALRARLLAALRPVDAVVLFEEATPLRTILALRPDVLVKGADFSEEEIVGAKEIRALGGAVVRVPRENDLSTTGVLARWQERSARRSMTCDFAHRSI